MGRDGTRAPSASPATTTSSTRATPTKSGCRSTISAPCSRRSGPVMADIEIPYGRQSIDDDDIAAVVRSAARRLADAGPRSRTVRGRAVRHDRRRARGRLRERNRRAARVALGDRNRQGRHGRDLAAVVRRQRELRAVGGRAAGVRRHRSEDAQPRPRQHRAMRRAGRGALRGSAHRPGRPRGPAAGRDRGRCARARRLTRPTGPSATAPVPTRACSRSTP